METKEAIAKYLVDNGWSQDGDTFTMICQVVVQQMVVNGVAQNRTADVKFEITFDGMGEMWDVCEEKQPLYKYNVRVNEQGEDLLVFDYDDFVWHYEHMFAGLVKRHSMGNADK
jgi:hypothetical protein